jgi:hypothetical protein
VGYGKVGRSQLHDRALTRHTEVRLDRGPTFSWRYQSLIDSYLHEIGEIRPGKRAGVY